MPRLHHRSRLYNRSQPLLRGALAGHNADVLTGLACEMHPLLVGLSLLCKAVEIEFTDAMLKWPKGNPTDDTWSKYEWYDTARNSTGFHPYKSKTDPIPERFQDLLLQCNEVYRELYKYRLV